MANANSAVLGLGLDSCTKVIENVERDEDLGAVFKAAYTSYIMGFFSGVNVVYEDNVGLEEFEQLYLKVLSNLKTSLTIFFLLLSNSLLLKKSLFISILVFLGVTLKIHF